MSKLTKRQQIDALQKCLRTQGIKMRELETRLSTQEKWSEYADEMLTALNHALPDPEYDAKCEAEVADVEASLDRHRERLGLNKPQLKQLDQSVFDGLDEKWRFAAVDGCTGRAYIYEQKPHFFHGKDYWRIHEGLQRIIGHEYDTTDWQNSLIERESRELTGSELCKAMIIGDRDWVLAYVSNENDATALFHRNAMVVTDFDLSEDAFYCRGENWAHAIPINNQGEPLTAKEVGL